MDPKKAALKLLEVTELIRDWERVEASGIDIDYEEVMAMACCIVADYEDDDDDDEEKQCEGCLRPATGRDVDGIPLCDDCAEVSPDAPTV